MELTALIDLANSKGYRPFFDQTSPLLEKLLTELALVGIKPAVLVPGNDLYSHALELERLGYVFQVMIRFDLRIFAIVVYRKEGSARYAVPYTIQYMPILRPLLDVLSHSEFEEITPEAGGFILGDGPLLHGMMGNTVFAFYFEDG